MKLERVQVDKAWAGALIIRLLRRWVAARVEGLNQIVTLMELGAELNAPLMLPIALDSLFHLTEQCLGRPLEAECCCSLDYSADEHAILLLIWVVADTTRASSSSAIPHRLKGSLVWAAKSVRVIVGLRGSPRNQAPEPALES